MMRETDPGATEHGQTVEPKPCGGNSPAGCPFGNTALLVEHINHRCPGYERTSHSYKCLACFEYWITQWRLAFALTSGNRCGWCGTHLVHAWQYARFEPI